MFTTIPNDYYDSFPVGSFGSLEAAIAYGKDMGKVFTVARPSGAVAATKAYPDSDVIIFA
jgi:hypothetical protein